MGEAAAALSPVELHRIDSELGRRAWEADRGELWRSLSVESGFADPDVEEWVRMRGFEAEAGLLIGSVATDGHGAVGFVEGVAVYEPTIKGVQAIGRCLYVVPSQRGTGLGRALMAAIVEESLKRGAKQLLASGKVGPHILEGLAGPLREYDRFYVAEVR